MHLIVGLGNPGTQYARTRHNAGWMVIDELVRRCGDPVMRRASDALVASVVMGERRVLLAKPQTFMNLSGRAVAGLLRYHRIERENLLVICDDLNLPLGRLRLRASGSDGGNNGLKSVSQSLASTEYARLRMGVGEPPRDERRERGTAGHVLSTFAADEWPQMQKCIAHAADCAELFVEAGIEAAMNRFNQVNKVGAGQSAASPQGETR